MGFWLNLLSLTVNAFSISSSGTVNNTVFIIPVPSSTAQALIPPQYGLLPVDKALFPGFPNNQHPLLVVGGQDYNITGTAGLFQFAQARFSVPFVDRLGDRRTPFSYTPSIFTDNPLAVLAATLATHTDVYLASIQPPMGSRQALYIDRWVLNFRARGKASESSGVAFVGEPTLFPHLPWPAASYFAIANHPQFGSKSDKCFHHVEYAPSGILNVKGTLWIGKPPLLNQTRLFPMATGVSAVKYFSETFDLDCSSFAS